MADTGEASPRSGAGGADIRPVPDPTVLTTQQLYREIATLRGEMQSLREILETRMDASDRATQLLQAQADKVPNEVDTKVKHLQELHDVKFDSIEVQFRERDVRTEQTARDSKVAVDAALQAAKEAVSEQTKSSMLANDKSEAATAKQIDQIGTLVRTTTEALNDKIGDIKSRLDRIEATGLGVSTAREVHQTGNRDTLGLVMGVVGVAGLIVTLIVVFGR